MINRKRIKYDGRIVQFGMGAVGKSFYEKLKYEIEYDINSYFVVTREQSEFEAYVNLGGMIDNFLVYDVGRDNYAEIFGSLLKRGDLLIDFADTVGTRDICDWCARNNIMYINTGEADWPDNWYSIFTENELKCDMRRSFMNNPQINRYPIVLQHGNNPGLVSHFVKAGLEYIVRKQFKKDKRKKQLLNDMRFNELAKELGVRMIQVNDTDLLEVRDEYSDKLLFNTWCVDSFWFEMLSEATVSIGTDECISYGDECNIVDKDRGILEFKKMAVDKKCRSYYPGGYFEGFLVPHEETITIAKSLEVRSDKGCDYRPTVMFVYSPCRYARDYMAAAKVNDYPYPDADKPMDDDINIIRGYVYPQSANMIYQENIQSGTEYVGVLIMGDGFDPVWIGNRIETGYLYKKKKDSYWQTPTITPVAMSALAAVCWMLKNKDKGGMYFPDDIKDYRYILKLAEKYISKTMYKTFSKEEVSRSVGVNFANIQLKDVLL